MKAFLLIAALTFSSMTFANSDLVTIDAYEVCPELRRMTQGNYVGQDDIEECISIIEPNKFLPEAFEVCSNLKRYITVLYSYSAIAVNECFDTIKNKNYSEGRMKMCKNLRATNSRRGEYTTDDDVIECLSK